ncbi:MAG: CDP-diacylglycerol--glycerol-3-phosphate 3-phosphatidyltransferase [Candidatus Omnitrophica bacterium]|nr:CDP-diacylglycerol--glycerol-3-phosphate 3-phosphatidyltransferase [Candidatus Omnitrophota bacterium]MBI3008075.1 CDP-diacylglycerol--glycerol-3-phosphate 3-phosphatidyltransferase [Candidatus Omnitrophota bacterium]
MNLPNKLTLSRIVLTFIFLVFLFSKGLLFRYLALVIFIVASLTDFYDGHIARSRNLVTDFGKLMDPIADKILVLAAFLAFVELQIIPAWMVVLVIVREFVITGMRLLAASKGIVLPADKSGKHKTASQMVAIFSILSYLAIRDTMGFLQDTRGSVQFRGSGIEGFFDFAIVILMIVTVSFTLSSGIFYLWSNKDIVSGAKTD